MPNPSTCGAEKAAGAAMFQDADVARCYAHRPPYAPALYPFLLEQVAGRGRALDLGCGPGTVAIVLADHFTEVVALDPSAAMIEAGRQADAGRRRNITWTRRRAEDLSTDQPFDLVAAGTAIHWMRHEVLFPKLAAMTPVLAVIGGDGRERPPCGLGAWIEFKTRWLARVGQAYDLAALNANARRHEPWLDLQGRAQFAFTFRQSVEDFIAAQHSTATWARAAMGETLAEAFDRELEALLRPHAPDGLLTLELVSELVWGAPRATPRLDPPQRHGAEPR